MLSMMLLLLPALPSIGTTDYEPVLESTDFDSSVGVQAGDLIYYDLTSFSLSDEFDIPNVTLPDFAGNSLFVKVMNVEEDYYFGIDDTGTLIHYAMGLMFNEDEIFTLGEGALATNIIIPEGAATPAIVMNGLPHFNGTYGYGPTQFFLNDDWADHQLHLEAIGFTVTSDDNVFEATQGDAEGEITASWRKSDGVLTYYLIDNYDMGVANYTGITIELQYDSMENNPLAVSVADNIGFAADILDVSITGTGDLWSAINQTEMDAQISQITAFEGKTLMKFVVTEIQGCYYLCDMYYYDPVTDALVLSPDQTMFNGFAGSISVSEPPLMGSLPSAKGPSYSYSEGIGPWITPDWDIYEGQMKLYDTLIGVYFNDLIDFAEVPTDLLTFTTITGNMELKEKSGYYYFRDAIDINIDQNILYSPVSTAPMVPQGIYDLGLNIIVEQESYICYTSTGVGAVIRLKADVTVTFYDDIPTTGYSTGSITVNVDVKLRNPDYDPPELIGNNFIPGFGWLVAFPAIFSIALLTVIRRRRK